MAFPPILALALAGGAAYLLMAPKKPAGASTPTPGPTPVPPNVITIPSTAIDDHPDVSPENAPTVTVTVPTHATGDKTDQYPPVQTASPPGASPSPTPPVGVATFPPLPGTVVLPTLVIPGSTSNPIPVPSTATPVQHEETQPDQDPKGTVRLAKAMIDAESQSGWKAALQSAVAAWQSKVGLSPDGKFGPGSAYKMALEVGILPLVRYYPKTTQLAADLKAYRDMLYTMAANADNNNPAHAAALRSSAEYEKGQAYTGTPKAIPVQARLTQAAALKTALGA